MEAKVFLTFESAEAAELEQIAKMTPAQKVAEFLSLFCLTRPKDLEIKRVARVYPLGQDGP